MALTKATTFENGLTAASAYARIISLKIDRELDIVCVGFGIYADKATADSKPSQIIERINVKYVPEDDTDEGYTGPTLESIRSSEDPCADIYEYEKTKEVWSDWSDS